MCDEDNPMCQEFRTIDLSMSSVRDMGNLLQSYGSVMSPNDVQRVKEAMDNMTDTLLLATARAKQIHSKAE